MRMRILPSSTSTPFREFTLYHNVRYERPQYGKDRCGGPEARGFHDETATRKTATRLPREGRSSMPEGLAPTDNTSLTGIEFPLP